MGMKLGRFAGLHVEYRALASLSVMNLTLSPEC